MKKKTQTKTKRTILPLKERRAKRNYAYETEGDDIECANCGHPMPHYPVVDSAHPTCHRCCSKNCLGEYYKKYKQGWFLYGGDNAIL